MGCFSGKKKEIKQEPMMTPAQMTAESLLEHYAKTGRWGGFQAGQDYTGPLGAYEMTEPEKTAQSQLLQLLQGTMPEMFTQGAGVIKDYALGDKFDPYSEKGIYSGFKRNVMREAGDVASALDRKLAITGDMYSTARAKEHGLLGERTQNILSDKLAELYDQFVTRKLGAAQDLTKLGLQEEGIKTGRIGLGMSLGSFDRLLKDVQAKEAYADWNRKRGEWLDSINAANTLWNKNVPYGMKTLEYTEPSPFAAVLNSGLQLAGTIIGSMAGGPAGAMAGSAIGSGVGNAITGGGSPSMYNTGTNSYASMKNYLYNS